MQKDSSFQDYPQTENETDIALLLMKWMGIVRRYWYWFVLSTILGAVVGYLYQQTKSRVYHSEAVVLIEQKDGNGASSMRTKVGNSQMNTLMQLNGITASDNIKNEIFILTSVRLMRQVVPMLNLDVDYSVTRSLHEEALYRDRPFRVVFDHLAKYSSSMSVKMNDDGTFTLSDFVMEGPKSVQLSKEKASSTVTAAIGQKVNTPVGSLTIEKDAAYDTFDRSEVVTVRHFTQKFAAELYKSRVSAEEMSKDCELIVLSCNDINRDRAEDVLYEIVEAYKQDVVNNKNRQAERTAEFIDSRLQLISRELSDVESRFAQFKTSNNIVDLSTTASTMTQQSLQARQQTNQLNTELSVARSLEEYLRTTPGSKDVIPVVSTFGNSAVASQINEYNRILLTRNRLADNSSDESPAVREHDRQLEAMRTAINSSLSSYIKSVELQLRAAQANEQHFVGQAGLVPVREKQAIDIARQQSMKEALYTYLLNKREEVALQLAIEEANVRLLEEPDSTNSPIAPRTKVILLIGLLAGLAFPFGVFYIIELFDTTITTRKDVEDSLSLPIVGELPHVEGANDKTLVYGPGADLSAPIAEAFRLLRYGMHYASPDSRVVLTTSSTPSHGKSFVSRNIAAAHALAGNRVLLIDGDIRVRNLSRNYGFSHAKGMTEYLIGDVSDISEIIVKEGVTTGVDFLPAGTMPPNTSELLMNARLDTLFAALREQYDYIFIDATPCFSVADASIMSRVSDITLFVIRVGEQERAGLQQIEELYESKKCGNLYAVINDTDVKTRNYGYGDGYRYSYSYGYSSRKKSSWWKLWK